MTLTAKLQIIVAHHPSLINLWHVKSEGVIDPKMSKIVNDLEQDNRTLSFYFLHNGLLYHKMRLVLSLASIFITILFE